MQGGHGIPGEAARSRYDPPRDKSEVCITVAPTTAARNTWTKQFGRDFAARRRPREPDTRGELQEHFDRGGPGWCAVVRRPRPRLESRGIHRERSRGGCSSKGVGPLSSTLATHPSTPGCEKPKGVIDRAAPGEATFSRIRWWVNTGIRDR